MDTSQPSGKLREYLLGGLPESERQAMEQRCFADDEFFLEVEAAEQDLIDGYVRGSLRSGERARFENSFRASPARARRVEIARHVIGYIDEKRPRSQTATWWQFFTGWVVSPVFIAAAACLIIISGVTVFWSERRSPVPQDAQIQRPAEQPNGSATAPRERPKTAGRPSAIPAFVLTPGLSRGASVLQTIRTGGATSVRFRLVLDSVDYTRYQASIETLDSRIVFSRPGLVPSSINETRVVVLTIPVAKLPLGDYILRLSGIEAGSIEPVADYSFRVVRN